MRYAKLGGLGICAATALWGGTALAQQLFTPQSLNNAYVSQPSRPPLSNLYLTVQEGYDSNVALSDDAIAAARGLKVSDEIFTPSVSLNVVIPRGLTTFFAGGNAGYNFYARNHILDRALINTYAGASTHFICHDTLVGDFEDQRQDDLIAVGQGLTNSVATGGVNLRAACGQQYGIAPSVSVGERWADNSTALFAPTDYRMFVASAELAYRRPVFGSIGLYGEFNDLSYDQNINVGGFFHHNGYNDFTGGVRYSHVGTRLYIDASVGYNDLVPDIADQPSFSGLSYALDVKYSAGPRIQISAGVTRAAVPTDLPYASFSVNSTYHAGLDFAANDRVRLAIGGQIAHDEYHGAPFVSGFLVDNQTVYEGDAHVDFWLSRRLDFGLYARELHRDVDIPGYSYTATIITAKISAKFGN